MLSPKYVELLERLSAGTKKGQVKWEETASNRVFITFFRGFSLSLERSYQPDVIDYIKVTLRDESGNTVDSFAVKNNHPSWSMVSELYSAIYETYSSERRAAREAEKRARETDAAVEELLNQLKIAS